MKYLYLSFKIDMDILPLEIKIKILIFICPNQDISLNHLYLKLFRCNYIWGPIVWERFEISKSCNFFEEFKWQLKLEKHCRWYQRQWTLGCVGKVESLGQRPEWPNAYTSWEPNLISCST